MASVTEGLKEAVASAQGELDAAEAELASVQALVTAKQGRLFDAKRMLRNHEDDALAKHLVLSPLPAELVTKIFLRLPLDTRLRCREVSRGWCAFLADVRHWQVCNLKQSGGVGIAHRAPALLRAVSERAQGTLRSLSADNDALVSKLVLLPVLRANADSLLALRIWHSLFDVKDVEELLAAAPRLEFLDVNVQLHGDEARGPVPRLMIDPQFYRLRMQRLKIRAENVQPPPDVIALTAWIATHETLKNLWLAHVRLDSEPVLSAVVNLASARQLRFLILQQCNLSSASLPALTRMLESGSLLGLTIANGHVPLLLGAAVPAFCAALRAARLLKLELYAMRLWESVGLAVIVACAGHPTLRTVNFVGNNLNVPNRAGIEAALDALAASIPGLLLAR